MPDNCSRVHMLSGKGVADQAAGIIFVLVNQLLC